MANSIKHALSVVQLTDLHLLANEDDSLRGVHTWRTFRSVLAHIVQESPRPDFILATGDLTQDGPRFIYQQLRIHLDQIGVPVHAVPGNHDDPELVAKTFAASRQSGFPYEHDVASGDPLDPGYAIYGNWLIIPLNSAVHDEQYGLLDEGELTRLDTILNHHPGTHALLCLHHQPVPCGHAGLDSIGLRNADALFAIVDHHPQVRSIVWGHIHNAFDSQRAGIRLLGTPATCFQFDAASKQIVPCEGPPGYRRLTLYPDGKIDSSVVWV